MDLNKKIQAIIFRDRGGYYEYLLLHTIPKRRSFWQNVTGKIEKEDSDLKSAAIREVFEETGVKDEVIKIYEDLNTFKFPVAENLKNKFDFEEFEETVFAFQIDTDTKIDIKSNTHEEHDDFIWCCFDGAYELLEYDSNRKALKILNEKLTETKISLETEVSE